MINSIYNLVLDGKVIGSAVRFEDGSYAVNYGDGTVHHYDDLTIEGVLITVVDKTTAGLDPDVVQATIAKVCDDLKNLLVGKNQSYGNSALDPMRILSQCSALEGIRVRIDDKLNRMRKGSEYAGDDTLQDITGYFILYLVGRRLGLR